MICTNCGSRNVNGNKFCTNCGVELDHFESTPYLHCSKCGYDNDQENKFCTSCGNKLQHKTSEILNHKHNKSSKHKIKYEHKQNRSINEIHSADRSNSKKIKIFWIATGAAVTIILCIAVFIETSNNNFDKNEFPIPKGISEVKSNDPMIEAKVYEIASKFVCSCGSCNEESLEICKCERSIEERQFIRDYLQQNQKPDAIVIALANKYGWMKAEFASIYNVDKSKIWNSNKTAGKLEINKELINSSPNTLLGNNTQNNLQNTIAILSDKYTIYSAFNCPCGKCALDELKDCNCGHPGGAQEIKKFVDEKISESKYSIGEITEMVNNKYGGKKI